jgi:hypothetical protein
MREWPSREPPYVPEVTAVWSRLAFVVAGMAVEIAAAYPHVCPQPNDGNA